MRALTLRLLVLTASLLTAAAAPARADDAAGWMFDPSVVVRIDLGLSDDALTALAAEPKEYVPASFALSYGTRQFGPWTVSLKLKGGIGSFRPIDGKAAFKLKFPAPTQSEKPADATAARAVPSVAAPDYDHMCAGRGSAGLLAPHSHSHTRAQLLRREQRHLLAAGPHQE